MLDHEDLKWIATTSTELNSMLQQISRYSDLARQHKGEYNYIDLLGERVEVASKTAQALFDRVTSAILTGAAARAPSSRNPSFPPSFSVLPPPGVAAELAPKLPSKRGAKKASPQPQLFAAARSEAPAEIKILKEKGKRELILLVDDEAEISDLASA